MPLIGSENCTVAEKLGKEVLEPTSELKVAVGAVLSDVMVKVLEISLDAPVTRELAAPAGTLTLIVPSELGVTEME
jgi:hypothetical protein